MEDRRIRKTKESIKSAYFELLKEKPFKDITVNQIAEKADINRGTFYLHYLDKFDLREQLENEVLEQLKAKLEKTTINQLLENPEQYSVALIELILQVIEDNREFFSVLLIHQDMGLPQAFSRIIRGNIERLLQLPEKIDIVPIEYYFAFIVNAQTGVLKQWVKNGMKETKHEVATYAYTLAYNGPLKLMHASIKERLNQ
ncbi:DNA-binding transcriptional regulator EnvR [Macrococcoides canis]|uniref:DNA-binding transcriptional regulator EnvR n=1 Tax=Macrococcoides canis TaxID=1855823 RepID=A0A1W7A835_9STAP|nr:TetR/AcrR family transcriptional regulator [Macrococcus canis]ARQ05761.1 DNA-binding transcriptional regulator EnvR [Macrococcus canis]